MERLDKELEIYSKKDYYAFHMPGHKRQLKGMDCSNPFSIDITEIDGFDNLHHTEGIIREAQEAAARYYGAKETFYCVNGSTAALLSAVSACTTRGGKILIARNCHKAVYHAAYLRGLEMVYVYPKLEKNYGLNGGIDPADIKEALEKEFLKTETGIKNEIQAVLITSPTYDGIVSDVEEIANITHKYKIPLIVDEAHGAHFCTSLKKQLKGNVNLSAGVPETFQNSCKEMHSGREEYRGRMYLPESSLVHGADVVIHSLHKTLPALTQTALLHCNGDLVSIELIRRFMGIYQTSSPSYVLMSSISGCIGLMQEKGEVLFEEYTSRLQWCREELSKCRYIECVPLEVIGKSCIYDMDASKIVLSVKKISMTGSQLYHILLEKYHLQMEMECDHYVLAMTSIGDTEEGFERLVHAVQGIDEMLQGSIEQKEKQPMAALTHPKIEMKILDAMECAGERVKLIHSAGKVSQEFIYLYPPGIPLLVPGELVTQKFIHEIIRYKNMGLSVQGLRDYEMKELYVCQN